jgi:hypothetical protein
MSDPRKCCLLGICCPPGGEAQKASMTTWLDGILAEFPMTDEARAAKVKAHVDALPWGKIAADFLGTETGGPADTTGEAV